MVFGAELGVQDTVHLHHVDRRLLHTVIFVSQFVPCRLEPLAMATPEHSTGITQSVHQYVTDVLPLKIDLYLYHGNVYSCFLSSHGHTLLTDTV